jgi:hypothetical protein
MMRLLPKRRPKLSRTEMLAAKPLRLVDADPQPAGERCWRLAVPVRAAPWARWVLRAQPQMTKKFELDELGLFVWNACDGKTPVQRIIRRLSKEYALNSRAAEVSTLAFLQTLGRKGLIGIAATKSKALSKQ